MEQWNKTFYMFLIFLHMKRDLCADPSSHANGFINDGVGVVVCIFYHRGCSEKPQCRLYHNNTTELQSFIGTTHSHTFAASPQWVCWNLEQAAHRENPTTLLLWLDPQLTTWQHTGRDKKHRSLKGREREKDPFCKKKKKGWRLSVRTSEMVLEPDDLKQCTHRNTY